MQHSEACICVNPETQGQADGFHDCDATIIYNGRAISEFHVKRICNHRFQSPRSDVSGLLIRGTHFESYFEKTHRYRFSRVNYDEVERFDLQTSEAKILGEVTDRDGEFFKVAKFVRRRRLRSDHCLFGSIDAEVWYGGHKDYSDAVLSVMWQIIEGATREREANNDRYPHTTREMRTRLILPLENMTDAEAAEITAAEFDNPDDKMNRVVIRKRKQRIKFRMLTLGATVEDIENRGKRIDLRGGELFTRAACVDTKGPI